MITEELMEVMKNHSNENGLPVFDYIEWQRMIATYEKDDIRDSLAHYVTENKVEFPYKKFDRDVVASLFHRFYNTSMIGAYKDFPIVEERYPYANSYQDAPLGVIEKSNTFNDTSDMFQNKNRMKCGSNVVASPYEIWTNEELLSRMNWHWWRKGVMEDDGITDKIYRSGFRLGTYVATQFKPHVAKAVYERHRAKNVLDTSSGWGDRLAGFYATPCTELYVGTDPNPEVYETYKEQCVFYEKILSHGIEPELVEHDNWFECIGSKRVVIYNLPCEDVNWNDWQDTFDMYFTSPPYFETEKYAVNSGKETDQSWYRYNNFELWKYGFFFDVTRIVWDTVKTNGYMMINIIEPRSKNGIRFPLCDEMVKVFSELTESHYIGKIGMRMMARPNSDKKELQGVFIEPIWVFRKGNFAYMDSPDNLDKFF